MNYKDRNIQLLVLSVIGFAGMSVSFLLMPFSWAGILPGLLFWLGLFLGIRCQMILGRRYRAASAAKTVNWKKWGAFTFFSQKNAVIADWALILSAVATLIVMAETDGHSYVCYVLLTATLFALCMHCILNGQNYVYATRHMQSRRVSGEHKLSKNKGGTETR